jgi:hypothetical protein
MFTANDLLPGLSRHLSDQESGFEYEHWDEPLLLDAFNYAVQVVAGSSKYRKYFSKQVEVPLTGTSPVALPDPCEGMVERTLTGPDGRPISGMKSFTSTGRFPLFDCVKEDGTNPPTGVYIDPNNDQQFYIDPPNATGSVFVNCFVPPALTAPDSAVQLPTTTMPVIHEFMLYYAYATDTESVPSRERSEYHWRNALTLLGETVKRA